MCSPILSVIGLAACIIAGSISVAYAFRFGASLVELFDQVEELRTNKIHRYEISDLKLQIKYLLERINKLEPGISERKAKK